jgi:cytochrome c peroxidase
LVAAIRATALRQARRLAAACAGICASLWAALGAAADGDAGFLDFSPAEVAVIASFGPWPPPATDDASNRWLADPAVAAYGRRLFSDPGLSKDGRVACASCHEPARAFQDGRAVAEGRGVGVRNTPTLLDVADRRWFGWGGAHDSLWAASLAPLLDPREMAVRTDELAARVRADPSRRAAFQAAFGAPVPADDTQLVVHMAKALAAYQATLRSPRTAFDAFRDALMRGDRRTAASYPMAAQRGLRLFIGAARCSVCHAGPAFTNDEFADIGVPFFVAGGVDAGRHAGLTRLLASPFSRLGEFGDSGSVADPRAVLTRHLKVEPRHFGEFRVPGLRQLTHTAPYMHDGSLPTLRDVVRHYDRLDEERLHADGERILRRLGLTEEQAADLEAFLRTLSD